MHGVPLIGLLHQKKERLIMETNWKADALFLLYSMEQIFKCKQNEFMHLIDDEASYRIGAMLEEIQRRTDSILDGERNALLALSSALTKEHYLVRELWEEKTTYNAIPDLESFQEQFLARRKSREDATGALAIVQEGEHAKKINATMDSIARLVLLWFKTMKAKDSYSKEVHLFREQPGTLADLKVIRHKQQLEVLAEMFAVGCDTVYALAGTEDSAASVEAFRFLHQQVDCLAVKIIDWLPK